LLAATLTSRRGPFGLARICALTLTAVVFPISSPAFAANSPAIFRDARLQHWARDFRAGKLREVLHSVEGNLRNTNAHPAAAFIWSAVSGDLRELKTGSEIPGDPKLKAALGILPQVYAVRQRMGDYSVGDCFSQIKPEGITDTNCLMLLSIGAEERSQYSRALDLTWGPRACIRIVPG
jgi:hypothetical protein